MRQPTAIDQPQVVAHQWRGVAIEQPVLRGQIDAIARLRAEINQRPSSIIDHGKRLRQQVQPLFDRRQRFVVLPGAAIECAAAGSTFRESSQAATWARRPPRWGRHRRRWRTGRKALGSRGSRLACERLPVSRYEQNRASVHWFFPLTISCVVRKICCSPWRVCPGPDVVRAYRSVLRRLGPAECRAVRVLTHICKERSIFNSESVSISGGSGCWPPCPGGGGFFFWASFIAFCNAVIISSKDLMMSSSMFCVRLSTLASARRITTWSISSRICSMASGKATAASLFVQNLQGLVGFDQDF